ncbi:MAG TPA: tRNA preQ1(34) S-adenosylmethionine ribosyltransferase-isomerase QueA [Pyrinomonadaceae bacterium]|nr:tRNA preQ1(34) S-adenosylmethionine ribosyltransferase-isomerase QueA [Pyrinomonadaceae bacterium]
MHISAFDYQLPDELIAQEPLAERDASRMLTVDRASQTWRESNFRELPEQLASGDVIVINNTRVFPARLRGRRLPFGGSVELLLARELEPNKWEALARPARRLRVGDQIEFADGVLRARVADALENGMRVIEFETDQHFDDVIDRIGEPPLPPYINRAGLLDNDRNRYQTVYATERGAIAAPTAGLHFTTGVLASLNARGVHVAEITLHVGYGTFEPVRVADVTKHQVAAERFSINEATAARLNQARANGKRIIAVGTTTARALESAASASREVTEQSGLASLTIIPGYKFRMVDGLLTNFHLPKSSLLMLVSTFAGHELVMAAYRYAVENRYRFYSYGDCMLIL